MRLVNLQVGIRFSIFHIIKSLAAASSPTPPSPSSPATSDTLNIFPALNSHQRASTPSDRTRKKVPLGPGFSPLDWAKLKLSTDLRGGVTQLQRYTLADLAEHRSRDNVWMAIQGKVYNVTSYVKFHPGGAGQLMRGAGKDATELFLQVHPWVNVDNLLDKCFIGFLVKDNNKPPGT
ncbi:hypothetical protein HDV00_002547 [Rhizophlyctis rosea]|nr:hypothetical protein HDV00_002547 [Rhizophlyctis rosea]